MTFSSKFYRGTDRDEREFCSERRVCEKSSVAGLIHNEP